MTEPIWPSYRDLSLGGVVAAGESCDGAAARELDGLAPSIVDRLVLPDCLTIIAPFVRPSRS
jgi:hypothetical protein